MLSLQNENLAFVGAQHCCALLCIGDLRRHLRFTKTQILNELEKYKSRMLPFMPGRRAVDKERAFTAIISAMLGALAIARILPGQRNEPAYSQTRETFFSGASDVLQRADGASRRVLEHQRGARFTRQGWPIEAPDALCAEKFSDMLPI